MSVMNKKPKNTGVCPNCGKTEDHPHRPFCSARCKLIDLGRWIDGAYRLPSEDVPDEAEIIDLASRTRQQE